MAVRHSSILLGRMYSSSMQNEDTEAYGLPFQWQNQSHEQKTWRDLLRGNTSWFSFVTEVLPPFSNTS